MAEEDRIRGHLMQIGYKQVHGTMRLKVLDKFTNVMVRPLSSIYKSSRQSKDFPISGKRQNVTTSLKKGKKEDPGSYRPVVLPSVSGKATEQILLEIMET